MTTYTGTQTVHNGIYLNTQTFSLTTMDQPGTLPGTALETYRRIPMVVMLAAAPLLGLAFVMFLPLIGFVMALKLVGTKALHLVADAAAQGVRVLRPSWAPAFAFLTRHHPAKPLAGEKAAAEAPDAWAKKVENELDKDVDDHR